MAATTPVGFDPKPKHLGLVKTFKATSAILAGQVVGYSDTGVSDEVVPATTSTGSPVGVALHSQATAGGLVAVAMDGSVIKVELSADDGTCDAGEYVQISAVAGTVITADYTILGHTSVVGAWFVGQALEDIAAGASTVGGKGYIVVKCSPIYTAVS